jgi:hypothetical protein
MKLDVVSTGQSRVLACAQNHACPKATSIPDTLIVVRRTIGRAMADLAHCGSSTTRMTVRQEAAARRTSAHSRLPRPLFEFLQRVKE